jgi:hypothetical protein
MTTTKNTTITISLHDTHADESVTAAYFVVEDRWVYFKSADHKVTAAYPESRIIRIKNVDSA